MPPKRRDTAAHRAIALVGWVLAGVGVVGLIVYPDLLVLWVFMIAFGVAAVPRALLELRSRHTSVARSGLRSEAMPASSASSSRVEPERRLQELDEKHFAEIDVAMLYIEEARERNERAAKALRAAVPMCT